MMDSDSHHVKNFRELLQDRVMKRLEAKAEYGKKKNQEIQLLQKDTPPTPNKKEQITTNKQTTELLNDTTNRTAFSTNMIWDRIGERMAAKYSPVGQSSRASSNGDKGYNAGLPSGVAKVSNSTDAKVSNSTDAKVSNSTDDIKTRIRAMSKAIGFASQIQDNITADIPKHATDRAAQIVRKISSEGKTRGGQDRRHTEQLLDLSQFGMKNLLEEASSVYEETLSQGKYMEDDYFSLPSVGSTQSLFSNISEYRAFSKYLQSNILTDNSVQSALTDHKLLTDNSVQSVVTDKEELSEELFMHYFQQLREVLHQEEFLAPHIPCATPDGATPTPDTPISTTPTSDTPISITPTPDTPITPTPDITLANCEEDTSPVQSPHTQPPSSNNQSMMVDSACQYSDDDTAPDTAPDSAPDTDNTLDTSCDVECQTEDQYTAMDNQTNDIAQTDAQIKNSSKFLSLKQRILKNLGSAYDQPITAQYTGHMTSLNQSQYSTHMSTYHQPNVMPYVTPIDSVYDVKVAEDQNTAQININNTVEENIPNIQVLVNLWSENTEKASERIYNSHDKRHHDECHHDECHHSGLLTCTSVPLFEEGEIDDLFTVQSETMKQLINQLDDEFSANHITVNKSCDMSPPITVEMLGSEDEWSDDTICSESDEQSQMDHYLGYLPSNEDREEPIAAQDSSHMTSLNQSQCRSQGNQTLALPFRLIKFLPYDLSTNHKTVFESHDLSPPIKESSSTCKNIQVDFHSLTNQEELDILDKETQQHAKRIILLHQSHHRTQVT